MTTEEEDDIVEVDKDGEGEQEENLGEDEDGDTLPRFRSRPSVRQHTQHKEMMDKLKAKFGTKSLIVNNIVGELEKMRKPENDPAFVSFVEKIEKMLRDVEAVNHREELSNEVVMTKIEDKMPEIIQDKWSDVVVDEELENVSSSVKFTRMMKFLEKFKNKADYHIPKNEASGSKSKSCVITGTTLVSHTVQDPGDNTLTSAGRPELSLGFRKIKPCLVCSKDGDKSEAAKHMMGSCKVFKAMPYKDKLELVKCIKCPFSNKDGHKTKDCKRKAKCYKCSSSEHATVFCDKARSVPTPTRSPDR